ncbi:hypothetical protein I6N96_12550 [Enterococcus sp. BWM-S5]|uniref:Uncharacterized protein n=1 Tax=Enterococcus larvae TaxID=2794352 RepID=A0ABS4CKG2_9ENTE|nr:hypothetical protein [Enterococcus larvae]MBP1047103.1 hypothetical protein [Enterococcus larvae]
MNADLFLVHSTLGGETHECSSLDEAEKIFDMECDHYSQMSEDSTEVYILQAIKKGFHKNEDEEGFVTRTFESEK